MSEHIGQDNAVKLERLVARTGLGERQVRDILEVLVKDYKWACLEDRDGLDTH